MARRKQDRCRYNADRENPWTDLPNCTYPERRLAEVPRPPQVEWSVCLDRLKTACTKCRVFEEAE